ncbi:DUF2790 domain-containing protein [Pseudomonas sp. CAM1A]|uniref:DUF2790 domain-containing protein n=1 Tax=Pseudomonas sp. CAM1A TaxID=3231717 RepID=UPI0039C6ABCE
MKARIGLLLAAALLAACSNLAPIGQPDIAKVISITDTHAICGVVPVNMLYEDSQGMRHSMSYRVLGDGCHDN